MSEWCNQGWTPKMGTDSDGMPLVGSCAAWQPVSLFNIKDNRTEEVYDCSVFGWVPDLLNECAKESSHTTASVDKVATETQKHRRMFLTALPPEAQQRIIEAPSEPPPAS